MSAQSLLLGVGFFAIGLPAAGFLSLATLLLGIVQVPATLLTLPVIGYVLATEATTPAIILFVVWTLVAGLSDNVLKPMMLGRGLEVRPQPFNEQHIADGQHPVEGLPQIEVP